MITIRRGVILGAAGLAGAALVQPAAAQNDTQIQAIEQQIKALQAQLRQVKADRRPVIAH